MCISSVCIYIYIHIRLQLRIYKYIGLAGTRQFFQDSTRGPPYAACPPEHSPNYPTSFSIPKQCPPERTSSAVHSRCASQGAP